MRTTIALKGVAYGAAVASAGAVMGVVLISDFGLKPEPHHPVEIPVPSIAVPLVRASPEATATPDAGTPPALAVRLPTADGTPIEVPGASAGEPGAPGAELTPAPGRSDPSPVPSAPAATPRPEPSSEPTGKPRPCGLVLYPQSQCGVPPG